MEEPKDILDKAIDALANTNVPPGPPKELKDATVAKLKEASSPAFLRKQEGGPVFLYQSAGGVFVVCR